MCVCVYSWVSVYVGMYISAFHVSVCPHDFVDQTPPSGLLDGQVSDVKSHQTQFATHNSVGLLWPWYSLAHTNLLEYSV